MSDISTRDTESKGCPSCKSVAATWISDCENPIHIHQANAHIHYLEQQLATAKAGIAARDKRWHDACTHDAEIEEQP